MEIKGIKPVTVRKKNGRVYRYYYHRATGTQLRSAPGTAEFAAEIAALNKRAEDLAPRDGSLHALIIAYRDAKQSPEWADLAPRTKADYQKVFDWLWPIREMALIEIDTAFIYALRDKAYAKRKRRFANYVVQVLRMLFNWGKPRKFLDSNPAVEVPKIKRPKTMKKANRAWADDEREAVLDAASVELRGMIALGMFAALREGDCCTLGKGAYAGNVLNLMAAKNGEALSIPAHYRLRKIIVETLEERQRRQALRAKHNKVVPIDPPTLMVSSRGRPWTENGFRASFFKLIGKLTKAGKVQPGLTFHGLRHTVGKMIIEAGGSKTDVAMMIGDRSEAMAHLYSQEHDKTQRVAATVRRLERSERRKLENSADKRGKP